MVGALRRIHRRHDRQRQLDLKAAARFANQLKRSKEVSDYAVYSMIGRERRFFSPRPPDP